MPLVNTITNLNLVLVGLIVAESAFVPTQIQDGFCCHLFCLLSRKVPNAAGSLKRKPDVHNRQEAIPRTRGKC